MLNLFTFRKPKCPLIKTLVKGLRIAATEQQILVCFCISSQVEGRLTWMYLSLKVQVLPGDAAPRCAAQDPEADPSGSAVPVSLLRGVRATPPGRWGSARGALRAWMSVGRVLSFGVVQVKRSISELPDLFADGNDDNSLHPSHFARLYTSTYIFPVIFHIHVN